MSACPLDTTALRTTGDRQICLSCYATVYNGLQKHKHLSQTVRDLYLSELYYCFPLKKEMLDHCLKQNVVSNIK